MENFNGTSFETTNFSLNEGYWNESNSTFENHIANTVPQWFVQFYFVFAFFGSVTNLIYAIAILRSRRNGTLSLVLQLSVVDCILFYVTVIEIYIIQNKSWTFSTENCQLFSGMEILTNALITYLIICLNFHIISLWNLHKYEVQQENNPLTSCRDDSDECLVTKNENSNRSVHIDYRKRRNDVSVVFPSIFTWFICISLSIPSFTLSTTLSIDQNYTICGIVDNFYGEIMQKLLLIFKIVIPLPLLIFSVILLLLKICKTTKNQINTSLANKFEEIRLLLIFCLMITVCFLLTSFQRHYFYINYFFELTFDKTVTSFRAPPLFNTHVDSRVNLYSSMLHYSSSSIRGSLYFYLVPKFRQLLRKKLFCYNI